jgi:hypothetical protein
MLLEIIWKGSGPTQKILYKQEWYSETWGFLSRGFEQTDESEVVWWLVLGLVETKRPDIQQLDKYRLGCRMMQDVQALGSSQLEVNCQRQNYGGSDGLCGHGKLMVFVENSTWGWGGHVGGGRMWVKLRKPMAGHEREQLCIDKAPRVLGNVKEWKAGRIQGCTIGSGVVGGKVRPGSVGIISCNQIF